LVDVKKTNNKEGIQWLRRKKRKPLRKNPQKRKRNSGSSKDVNQSPVGESLQGF